MNTLTLQVLLALNQGVFTKVNGQKKHDILLVASSTMMQKDLVIMYVLIGA
jgi:hypothetical protein